MAPQLLRRGLGVMRHWMVMAVFFLAPCGGAYAENETAPADRLNLYLQSANLMLQTGKWTDAIPLYQSALEMDAVNTEAHVNLGCALALTGQDDAAIEEFKATLSAEPIPHRAFIFFNLGGAWLHKAFLAHKAKRADDAKRSFEEASTHLRKAVETLPGGPNVPGFVLAYDWGTQAAMISSMENASLFNNLIFSVDEKGLPPDTAIFMSGKGGSFLFDVDSLPPLYFYRSPSVFGTMCLADLQRGDVKTAEQHADQALKLLAPGSGRLFDRMVEWNVILVLAQAALVRESLDEATQWFSRARQLNVDRSSTDAMLLKVLLLKQDIPGAQNLAKEILAVRPDDSTALKVSKLQLASPHLDAEGYYISAPFGFRVKKPEKWLVFDRETNAESFLENTNDPNLVGYFVENPAPLATAILLHVEPVTKPINPEDYLSALKVMLSDSTRKAGERLEGPQEIQVNSQSFIWYRTDNPGSQTSASVVTLSWIRVTPKRIYSVVVRSSPERIELNSRLIEETIQSFRIES